MHARGRINLGISGSDELLPHRGEKEPPEFDITAMVDLVFLMNLYFLVTFLTVAMGELALPAADHASALDADSDHKEGEFYVWTPEEIEKILGKEDAALLRAVYGVSGNPNFEEKAFIAAPITLADHIAGTISILSEINHFFAVRRK